MIINDIYGERRSFLEEEVEGFYFDNSESNDWVEIIIQGTKIRVSRGAFAAAFPHVVEQMPLRYETVPKS